MPVGPQSPRVYSAGILALFVILDPPTTPEPLSLSVAPTSFLGHFQEIPFFSPESRVLKDSSVSMVPFPDKLWAVVKCDVSNDVLICN